MRTLASALVAICLSTGIASAKPRTTPEIASATSKAREARDELKRAKAAAKLASHRVRLAKARAAALKANRRLNREQWIADCLVERTGPKAGVTAEEAMDICTAEAPDLDTFTGETIE